MNLKSNIKLFDILEEVLLEAKAPGEDYNKYKKEDFIQHIKNKRIVSIFYNGLEEEGGSGWRSIEPVAIGEGNPPLNGLYIRAWLISGKSVSNTKTGKSFRPRPGWRFFKVSRIGNINVGTKNFDQPHPGFNSGGDKQLSKIYAITDFNKKTPLEKSKSSVNKMKGKSGDKGSLKEYLENFEF